MGRCRWCGDATSDNHPWCVDHARHGPGARRALMAAGVELGIPLGETAHRGAKQSRTEAQREIRSLSRILGLKTVPEPGKRRGRKARMPYIPSWSPATLAAWDLAKRAGISVSTAKRFRKGQSQNLRATVAEKKIQGLSDIQVARGQRGWSLREVGSRAKCSAATVHRIEQGHPVTQGVVHRVRRVLGLANSLP